MSDTSDDMEALSQLIPDDFEEGMVFEDDWEEDDEDCLEQENQT